jgi:hypothetical protein
MNADKHDAPAPGSGGEFSDVVRAAIDEICRQQPEDAVVERVIARACTIPSSVVRAGLTRPGSRIARWAGKLTPGQRIALGGVVAAAALALFLVWTISVTRPVSAMEQMAEKIRQAKSCKYTVVGTVTYDSPEPGKPLGRKFRDTHYWLAPGSDRSDFQQTGDKEWDKDSTNIEPAGKPRIWIDHLNKRFYREPPRRDFDKSAFDDLELLGEFSGKADRELGTRMIDGKEARGFQIEMRKMEPEYSRPGLAEIWIDAESNLPVLVRYEGIKRLGQSTTMEMTDICWNIDLDPKLFDTMPPKGYTDGTTKPPPLAEQLRQITAALKIYADASGGHYPSKQIDPLGTTEDLCRMLGVTKWPGGKKEGKAGQAAKAINGFQRIGTMRLDNPDFAYYGQTVGPKDQNKVLLRWRLDDGRYEVIFGDLRAETVAAERLRVLEGK